MTKPYIFVPQTGELPDPNLFQNIKYIVSVFLREAYADLFVAQGYFGKNMSKLGKPIVIVMHHNGYEDFLSMDLIHRVYSGKQKFPDSEDVIIATAIMGCNPESGVEKGPEIPMVIGSVCPKCKAEYKERVLLNSMFIGCMC